MQLAEAYVTIRGDRRQFQQSLSATKGEFSAGLKSMATTAARFAPVLGLAGISTAFVMSVRSMVRTAGDFEQSMANVGSVTGGTADEVRRLGQHARRMGMDTIFGAKGAADAMYYLASAGMNTNQIMNALQGTMRLAAATQSDLASTTETVASVISAFGLKAEEADRIANTFAATISASQATMGKLAASMGYVGPVARSLNMSIEETSAILGSLYNAGIDASTAGTSLRFAISSIVKPTSETIETLDRLGVSLKDSEGKTRPFIEIIRDLGDVGIDTADAFAIFGQRAGPGMLALINQGADAIEDLTKKVTGTKKAAEMAGRQTDTFQGQVKLLGSAVEELAITIMDSFLPAMKQVTSVLVPVIKQMSKWVEIASDPAAQQALENWVKAVSSQNLYEAVKAMRDLVNAFRSAEDRAKSMAKAVSLASPYETLAKSVAAADTGVDDLGEGAEKAVHPIRTLVESLKQAGLAAEKFPAIMPEAPTLSEQLEAIKERISLRGKEFHEQQRMAGQTGKLAYLEIAHQWERVKALEERIAKEQNLEDRMALIREKHMIEDELRHEEWAGKRSEIEDAMADDSERTAARIARAWKLLDAEFLENIRAVEETWKEISEPIDITKTHENLRKWGAALKSTFANTFADFGHEMLNFKKISHWTFDDIGDYWKHTKDAMKGMVDDFADHFRQSMINATADILASESMKALASLLRLGGGKAAGTAATAGGTTAAAAGGTAASAVGSTAGPIAAAAVLAYGWGKLVKKIIPDSTAGKILSATGGLIGLGSYLDWFAKGGIVKGGLQLPRLQTGGIIRQPTLAMIGEGNREEAVIPLKGGAVPVRMEGKGRGDVHLHLDNITIQMPNATLENADPATIQRFIDMRLQPALRRAHPEWSW